MRQPAGAVGRSINDRVRQGPHRPRYTRRGCHDRARRLRVARKRIRELETELAISRQAWRSLAEENPHPRGLTRRSRRRRPCPGDRPPRRRRYPGEEVLPGRLLLSAAVTNR